MVMWKLTPNILLWSVYYLKFKFIAETSTYMYKLKTIVESQNKEYDML